MKESTKYDQRDKLPPNHSFANKDLLDHSYAPPVLYWWWLSSCYNSRVSCLAVTKRPFAEKVCLPLI